MDWYLQKKRLLGMAIDCGSYELFLSHILNYAKRKKSSYMCMANVHMLIEAYNNRDYADPVNKADIVAPDGMPLVKALRILYGINQSRIAGMDLMPDLIKEAERENLSIFFYGGTEEVLNKIKNKLAILHPSFRIAGMYAPPFRKITEVEEREEITMINNSGANIVLVSLGCPKQEIWMARNKYRINAIMIGIGGAFPVFAGLQKRAPEWMQKMSLEWLYRLIQEPGRLWKRYLYTNTKFLILLMAEIVKFKIFKHNKSVN